MEVSGLGDRRPRAGHRLTRLVVMLLRAVAALGMLLMMVITFADVAGRYFMRPIFGAPEMIQVLLALTIFAGLGLASIRVAHITVDIFVPPLRRWFGQGYDLALRLASVLGFGLIAWQLGRLALEAARAGRLTIVLEWPLAWVIASAAVLAACAFYLDLIGHVEKGRAADGEFVE